MWELPSWSCGFGRVQLKAAAWKLATKQSVELARMEGICAGGREGPQQTSGMCFLRAGPPVTLSQRRRIRGLRAPACSRCRLRTRGGEHILHGESAAAAAWNWKGAACGGGLVLPAKSGPRPDSACPAGHVPLTALPGPGALAFNQGASPVFIEDTEILFGTGWIW